MEERFVKINDANIFVLKTDILFDRKTIVCVHGLGESLICYSEAFRELDGFNIIAMDNAGYGKSKAAESGEHSTESQAKRIFAVLNELDISQFILMGHSWGGDIGTFMCKMDGERRIEKYINIESDIHTDNVIMSLDVSKAFAQLDEEHFNIWLKNFKLPNDFHSSFKESFPQTVMKWNMASRAAGLRYLASVRMCESPIYGETATEIALQHKSARKDGVIKWGEVYAGLMLQTVYCWGTESLAKDSKIIRFLNSNKLPNKGFEGASHWVMMDNCSEFYEFVRNFINE